MKLTITFLVIVSGLFCGTISSAQNTMMAGKITDEDGTPLKGAIIQVLKGREVLETRSDDDGLFYTQLFHSGYYRVGIEANGEYYKTKKMWILPAEEGKFYYFSIKGKRVYVEVDGEDPFLKSKLSKIADEVPLYDFGGRINIISSNSLDSFPNRSNGRKEYFLIQKKGTDIGVPREK